jgi:hypothetical protein
MDFLRKHWYDLGAFLALITIAGLFCFHAILTNYQLLMWLNLISLFFHQLEEYRIIGTFPGMVNKAMYKSDLPDRYPLNTNTSLYINVFIGWGAYTLAAVFAEHAVWLGIATILVSVGNIVGHTTLFNIKGKTKYNPGLATCWLFFAPCVYFFFTTIHHENLVTISDYLIGVTLGIVLNVVGIVKLIDWMADKNTKYIFEQRNLLPQDRNK